MSSEMIQVGLAGATGVFMVLAIVVWGTETVGKTGVRVPGTLAVVFGSAFAASVLAVGLPFVAVSANSLQTFWIVLALLMGYAAWGVPFVFGAGYVAQVVFDVLVATGLVAASRSPFASLAAVGALTASALMVVLAFAPAAIKRTKRGFALALREPWGEKYLIAFVLIALVVSPLYADSDLHVQLVLGGCWLVLFVPGTILVLGVRRVEALTRALLLFTLAVVAGWMTIRIISSPLGLFAQPDTSVIASAGFRAGGSLYGANQLSLSVLALSPYLLAFLRKRTGGAWTQPLAILFLAVLMYRGDTRTAWFGFLPVLAVFYGLLREWKQLAVVIATVSIGLLALPYLAAHALDALPGGRSWEAGAGNLAGRLRMWRFALDSAWTSPPTVLGGVGWGAEPATWPLGLGGDWRTMHSAWVAILVRSGVVGAALWMAFLLEPLIRGLRVWTRFAPSRRSDLAAGLAAIVGLLFFSAMSNLDWPQSTQLAIVVVLNVWTVAKGSLLSASGNPT